MPSPRLADDESGADWESWLEDENIEIDGPSQDHTLCGLDLKSALSLALIITIEICWILFQLPFRLGLYLGIGGSDLGIRSLVAAKCRAKCRAQRKRLGAAADQLSGAVAGW